MNPVSTYLRDIQPHSQSKSRKTVHQNQLSLSINNEPGPVVHWVAHGMEPLHGDGQGEEDGGGEGGVVQAVEHGQYGAKRRELARKTFIIRKWPLIVDLQLLQLLYFTLLNMNKN